MPPRPLPPPIVASSNFRFAGHTWRWSIGPPTLRLAPWKRSTDEPLARSVR